MSEPNFEGLSVEEMEALDVLTNGGVFEDVSPSLVEGLNRHYMISEFDGNRTVPAIVWKLWENYKEQTGWEPNLDDRLCVIKDHHHPMSGFRGRAMKVEGGEYLLYLDATDPEDDRVIQHLSADQLQLVLTD